MGAPRTKTGACNLNETNLQEILIKIDHKYEFKCVIMNSVQACEPRRPSVTCAEGVRRKSKLLSAHVIELGPI